MSKRLAVRLRALGLLFFLICCAAMATAGVSTEDFTSTLNRDPSLTTAWWDTTADGELKLYPFTYNLIGDCSLTGEAYAAQVAGKHAFVAAGSGGLWVVDISDPANPIRVGHYVTDGVVYDVCVAGNRAFLAEGSDGVKALDITDPTNPTLLASFSTLGQARGVCMAGDKIYVAYGVRGLVVLTMLPVGLVQIGVMPTPGDAMDVQVAGDLAFVADEGQGLQVLDIIDPAYPELVDGWDTPGLARGVFLAGDLIFVADTGSGLQIIDASDPTSLALAGSYATAGEARGVWVDGDRAYVADSVSGLLALDVGDPSAPALIATVAIPGTASCVQICGEQAYLAAGAEGLQVVDVRDLAVPTWTTRVSLGGDGRGIDVAGNLAYVAAYIWGGLKVVDISDPASPVEIGGFNTLGFAMDVAVSGDHAYVAGYDAGLQVIDVSDPTNPVQVGLWNTPSNAMAVCVSGDMAYVADYASNLQIIDVSDPHNPVPAGSYDTAGLGYDICVDGNHVFLADATGGVRIFDVSIPSAPVSLGVCPTLDGGLFGSRGVFATGNRLYVGDGAAGLQIFDIRNPALPVRLGGCDTPGTACRLQVAGQYAFVADWTPGLHVFDVSDPSAPVLAGTVDSQDYSRDVCLAGDYAYVPGSNFGMEVVQVWQEDLDTQHNQGGSLPLSPSDGDANLVSMVRLTTEQVGDVTWQVQTTQTGAGPLWQEIVPDESWHAVAPGWDLRWLSTHAWSPGTNPTVDQLTLEWLTPAAGLTEINDVPDDQGGWLHVQFLRSACDFATDETPIASYGIWRRVDDPDLKATLRQLSPDNTAKRPASLAQEWGDLPVVSWQERTFICSLLGVEPSPFFPPGIWEWVASVPALQIDTYLAAVPTLGDWTLADPKLTVLVITAHTTVPALWYVSPPDSASSYDNIAPGVPEGLTVAYHTGSGNSLSWEPCADEDFQYFNIYRGDSPYFEPQPEDLVHSTIDSAWSDPESDGWDVWYKATAVDHVGNESDPASPATVTGTPPSGRPYTYALHGNVPNPFNPQTTIAFELPEQGAVTLRVYDLAGRIVRVLVDGEVYPTGRHEVLWNGRDDAGRLGASGTYFYRLEAGEFSETKRMVLIK